MLPFPTSGSQTDIMREKLSAFVITHNRAALLETCLRAVSFADELIVIDKSSTDGSAAVAARHASRVEIVPWSPTVEETRAFALSLCRHERILFLDDDEILSPETGPYTRDERIWAAADIHGIPLRHYILGVHDERAYYWPERHHRLFRKGAVEFLSTVHGGVAPQSDRIAAVPVESGVCIHHLSHTDVASWIERTNRYTSRPNRACVTGGEEDLIRFSHDRIDHWMKQTTPSPPDAYPAAVAMLRAIYDMVDRLKTWETARGLDGTALFRMARESLAPGTAAREAQRISEPPHDQNADDLSGPLDKQAALVRSRALEAELRDRVRAARESDTALTLRTAELSETRTALAGTDMALTGARTDLTLVRAALTETNTALANTNAMLAGTGAALDHARNELTNTQNDLTNTQNDLTSTRAMFAGTTASLEDTRSLLGETRNELTGTRAALGDTTALLTQTGTALDAALTTLAGTRVSLAAVTRELEWLSGSARGFLRQYAPKLWRHLFRWRRPEWKAAPTETH